MRLCVELDPLLEFFIVRRCLFGECLIERVAVPENRFLLFASPLRFSEKATDMGQLLHFFRVTNSRNRGPPCVLSASTDDSLVLKSEPNVVIATTIVTMSGETPRKRRI